MAISVGDKIPDVTLRTMTAEGTAAVQSADVLGSGEVVLIAVPGAFTPTCSDHHLPGFVLRADDLAAKGVDTIACVAVNDPFVMGAWGQAQGTDGKATTFRQKGDTRDEVFEGSADRIEYDDQSDVVRFVGNASARRLLGAVVTGERAGLVVTRRQGREKLHFLNPVPIRLIHDRWIDKYRERQVSALADLKHELEKEDTA